MIRRQFENSIARVVIDRPERRNSFDRATCQALGDAIEAANADPAMHVLVVEGAGSVFSTGRDLKAAAAEAQDSGRSKDVFSEDNAWVRIFQLLQRGRLPSVSVVRGYAVAGGFTLSMACDFVLSTRAAVFGAYEMKHGFPASVCTPILSRILGPRLGLEFAMFGEAIPAERLFAAGVINRLAEDDAELERIREEFVGHLASLNPQAVKLTRDTFRAAENMPLDNALDVGRQLNQLIAALGGFAAAGKKLEKR